MKKLLLLSCLALSALIFSQYKTNERGEVTFEPKKRTTYQLHRDITFSEEKKLQVTELLNNELGKSANNKVWKNTSKEKNGKYSFTIINNKIVLEAEDSSESQQILKKCNAIFDKLKAIVNAVTPKTKEKPIV